MTLDSALERWTRRDVDRLAIAALFLLTCLPLARYLLAWPTPLIFPNEAFHYGTDLVRESWSIFRFSADTLRETGTIALWRPYLLSGAPLIGHPVAPVLYPPNALTLVLPLSTAFDLLLWFHLGWAGTGVYLYLRVVSRLRAESAFAGALIVALAPRLFAHIGGGHLPLIEAFAWWPWAWLAFSLYWQTGDPRWSARRLGWAVLLGIALAMLALTDGRYLAMSGLWLAAATLWIVAKGRLPAARAALVLGLVAVGVGIGLSAGEIGPLAQLLPYSSRVGRGPIETSGGLEPALLLNVMFRSSIVDPESYTFMGITTIALALFGAASRRPYRERCWVAAAGLALLLSLGTNLPISIYPLLMRLIPIFGLFRAPGRWWLYVIFALAILAAFGLEKWQTGSPARRWLRPLLLGLGTGYVALWLTGGGLPFVFLPGAIVLPLVGILILTRPARWKAIALVGMLAIDLGVVDLELTVPQSEAALTAPDPVVTLLRGVVQPDERVFDPYGTLPEAAPVADHLAMADGYDSFTIGAYTELIRRASGCDYTGYVVGAPPMRVDDAAAQSCPTLRPVLAALRLLAIRYVILPRPEDLPESQLVYHDDRRTVYDIGPG
ncbi:MAG TPA: hypothetical protein VMT34_13505, partial [Aggregatilineales bacterium]|nr:hypothetical protein [Aggregatilineales bacterium]